MNIAFCSTCMDPITLKFNFDISEPKAKIMEAMEKLLDLQWSAILPCALTIFIGDFEGKYNFLSFFLSNDDFLKVLKVA